VPSPDRTADAPAPLCRRERKKLETKERIIDCAVAQFASRGYDTTTMEDIGECADVARATVFNYFARKEDIVSEVLRRRRVELAQLITEARETTSDTRERFRQALAGLARLYEENPAAGRATVRASLRAGFPLTPDAFDSAALFADVVREGQENGDIAPDLDATRAGFVIFDAYLGVLFRWISNEGSRYAFEENLMAALDLVLDGISRKPSARRAKRASSRKPAGR
jgi:TetR/AcrR family transcriptional regulator, cholesterol catabolism regulator